jgi:DNA polymerase III alpha subunit (gram-positive type)
MMFDKDILVIDWETTGVNQNTLEPIEIGAILLSHDDFSIKEKFHSHILAKHPEIANEEALKISGKTKETIMSVGEPLEDVMAKFDKTFFHDQSLTHDQVLLASWNTCFDIPILLRSYIDYGIDVYSKFSFDYHYLDLWSLMVCHKVVIDDKNNRLGGVYRALQTFGLEGNYYTYGAPHNALKDCMYEVQILRQFFNFYTILENVEKQPENA